MVSRLKRFGLVPHTNAQGPTSFTTRSESCHDGQPLLELITVARYINNYDASLVVATMANLQVVRVDVKSRLPRGQRLRKWAFSASSRHKSLQRSCSARGPLCIKFWTSGYRPE
jgi:hypothetical protein